MISLKQIFAYFERTKRPTQSQFAETFSSFWHKSERLPLTQVQGLSTALDEKASKEDLANASGGLIPMGDALDMGDLMTKPKRPNDSYYVLDQLDENGNPYIFRYDAELGDWINTKLVAYSSSVVKQIFDLGVYIDESEYMRIYTDSEGRFLWGIKNDGSVEWGKGVPMPIQIELNKVIFQIIDTNADLDFKVDKEKGYSLIADAVSEYLNNVNDTDFLELKTDSEGRILHGITRDGKPYYPKNAMYDIVDSNEYVELVLDRDDKIVHSVKPDNDSDIVTVSEVLDENVIGQIYRGGYIEIQPDSYNAGSIPATDSTTDAWGFPYSLNDQEQLRLRELMLKGDGYGVMYVRLPLGYAYRGYRNIDAATSLAKNIGERYEGQNEALLKMCGNIAKIGGGIAPEYWCHAPYWLTSGAYAGKGKNEISAGVNAENGTTQKTPLRTIKNTFPTQYNSRIDEHTDAIVNDLEYLHQTVAPVRMFGLQNEPELGVTEYGSVEWDAQTYNDVLEVLISKIDNSEILSVYDGKPNKVLIHVASTYAKHFNGIPSIFIANHANKIWGYSHHYFLYNPDSNQYIEPDYINDIKGNRKNVFNNEFEYFVPSYEVSVMHQRCANNIQHIINELVHGEAEVIQPIIHICKQLGQNSATSNTVGYSMFECNLQEGYGYPINSPENTYRLNYGEFKVNNQNYNSWKMFADNLPIGAVRVGNKPTTKRNGFSWCAYMAKGKRVILVSNNSGSPFNFKLRLNARSSFAMKRYDLFNCGADMGTIVTSRINVEIPLYSGVCFVEQ